MHTLILKLGATGDVVRTTPLLDRLPGSFTWITEAKNAVLLQGLKRHLRCLTWEDREKALDRSYDLAINLEDTVEVANFLKTVDCSEVFGACLNSDDLLTYTENSKCWFDLSLISTQGKLKADKLKFENRKTYQELVFEGLGLQFTGETYLLSEAIQTRLAGDVAIAAEAGAVWPMKKWAYYNELKRLLEDKGLIVNILRNRASLLEHLSDVRNHQCLVGGDSLPMHFALGTATPCVTLFTCTSPWEIYDYGLQKKIVSPLLEEFFYKRGYDERATTAISVDEVFDAVIGQLEASASEVRNQTSDIRRSKSGSRANA
jgi:ADP-heptose:LPS heptosyltransferase